MKNVSFSYFSQKIGFDISCKLCPCRKCQTLCIYAKIDYWHHLKKSISGLNKKQVIVNACMVNIRTEVSVLEKQSLMQRLNIVQPGVKSISQ